MSENYMEVHQQRSEPWKVTLVDTGEHTMTGGRLLRIARFVRDEDAFFFTYGDGLADIDIAASLDFHIKHGKYATLTAASPPGRFGALDIHEQEVRRFNEKPKGDGGKINAGFFILSPSVLELLKDDSSVWEQEPLMSLAESGELMAFEHTGFWQPMDTLRDKMLLEELWQSGNAPWKKW
jgi:glucose-1-phosphate cytidylyltransferase